MIEDLAFLYVIVGLVHVARLYVEVGSASSWWKYPIVVLGWPFLWIAAALDLLKDQS